MALAPPARLRRIMAMCQVTSSTKLLKVSAPALGRGGAASCCWIPRPRSFGEAVELDLPRTYVGVNEYLYALSRRHPQAVRCRAALKLFVQCRRCTFLLCNLTGLSRVWQGRWAARQLPLGT